MGTKDKIREALAFEPLTEEEKSKRGILGRLYGPCASIAIPTRNGRLYSERLWDYQFKTNSILNEMFANGGIPMELDHPSDREDTDSSKIAAMMPEMPKKDKDGHLICYCDIIDTPCGRIAYQLAKYGFKLGISSRGTGDLITDEDGNESVDPETYDLTTFDLVLVPAVEDARLQIAESLDSKRDENMLNFRKALTEELDKASPEERKAMQETLQNLNIDLGEQEEVPNAPQDGVEDKTTSESESPENAVEKAEEASNDGSEALIKSFQEALMKSAELEQRVRSLQEQLAVSDAEVSKLRGEGDRQRSVIVNLTKQVKASKELGKSGMEALEEELKGKDARIAELEGEVNRLQEAQAQAKRLRESMAKKRGEAEKLQESVKGYQEQIAKLNEELSREREGSKAKIDGLTEEASNSKRLAEGYKRLANKSVDKYIELKAVMLGIDPQAIKGSLKEHFTFQDVDDVCDALQGQEINLSRLPFRVGRNMVVKVNESRQSGAKPSRQDIYDDDYVDDALLKVAGVVK